MKKYPISEFFHSWQGEGCHMGKSAFFIRLMGCPIKCVWCDSAETWKPGHMPDTVERYNAEELLQFAETGKFEFIVITGGEPTIHDLTELTTTFSNNGYKIHLETCGAFKIFGKFDWVTVSPKWASLPLDENLNIADEIKLIVEERDSIKKWWDIIKPFTKTDSVWLHPEWSLRNVSEITEAINFAIAEYGKPLRVGFQLHKLYNAT